MAAAETERGLAFFTFKDSEMARELADVYHLLVTQGTTVGESCTYWPHKELLVGEPHAVTWLDRFKLHV